MRQLLPFSENLFGNEVAILVAILTIGLCTAHYILQKARKSSLPLPPSPPARAWTGHIHAPLHNGHQYFELLRTCGPLALLKRGPSFPFPFSPAYTPASNILVLNTVDSAVELLERRGARYSSRPRSIAAGEHLSGGRRMVMMAYGDRWRRHHRAFAQVVNTKNVPTWRRAMEAESEQLLRELLALPANSDVPMDGADVAGFPALTSRFTASTVLQLAYARRAPTPAEPVLRDLAQVSALIFDAFTPGNYWVDRLPLLDYLPAWLSPWKRRLRTAHALDVRINGGLVEEVRVRLAAEADSEGGTPTVNKPSICGVVPTSECAAAVLLHEADRFGLDSEDVAYLCAQLFEAGTETTAMTLNTLLLACAAYPAVCARAQAELDAIVPPGRLPTFNDLRKAPYVRALIREALRLTPTGSTGVGHVSTSEVDEEYAGLRVPAGCMILANHYGIHHDAEEYPDPWRFAPERWIDADGDIVVRDDNDTLPKGWHAASLDLTRGHHAFGFGRRICPGLHLAANSRVFNYLIPFVEHADTESQLELLYHEFCGHSPPFQQRLLTNSLGPIRHHQDTLLCSKGLESGSKGSWTRTMCSPLGAGILGGV